MGSDRLQAAVPDGEALRYTASSRGGGAVGLTDDRLLFFDGDESVTSVEYDTIDEVTAEELDWFLAVLSAGLAGFGLLSLGRSLPVGAGFTLAGLGSLYLVYRNRGEVNVSVHDRAKPLSFHLDDPETFLSRLESRLDDYEARLHAEHAADPEGTET
jgi:hypothetical protein